MPTARKANVPARVFNLLPFRIAPCKIPFLEQTRFPMTDESCHMDGKIRLSRSDSAETLLLQEASSLQRESYPKLLACHSIPRIFDAGCELESFYVPTTIGIARGREITLDLGSCIHGFVSSVLSKYRYNRDSLCEREIRIRKSEWLILSFEVANEFISTHVMNYILRHASHKCSHFTRHPWCG